jgi:hypothetical protein
MTVIKEVEESILTLDEELVGLLISFHRGSTQM